MTLYTDQIIQNNDADTNIIIRQIDPTNVDEFLESAKSIRVLCAFRRGKKFDDFSAISNRR